MKLKFTHDGALSVREVVGATIGKDPATEKLWKLLADNELVVTPEVKGTFRPGLCSMTEIAPVIRVFRRGDNGWGRWR